MIFIKFFTVFTICQFCLTSCICQLLTISTTNYDYDGNRMAPIILVHGVTKSQIMGKYSSPGPLKCPVSNGWEHLWMNVDIAFSGTHYQKCWAYRLKLLYDRSRHKCTNQVGVQTRVEGSFGSLGASDFVTDNFAARLLPDFQYFHKFITAFEMRGYTKDFSLKLAPYDWRYAPREDYGAPTIDKSVILTLSQSFQSLAYLLPQEEAFAKTVLVEWVPKGRKYTAQNYQQFFQDAGFIDGYLMRQDLRHLYPVPLNRLGVKYVCTWANSSKIETPITYRIKSDKLTDTSDYEKVNTVGDAVVPLKSLRYCEKFPHAIVKGFQGHSHTGLIKSDEFFDYVSSVVSQAQPVGAQAQPGGSQGRPGRAQGQPGGSQGQPGGSQVNLVDLKLSPVAFRPEAE
ncbi:lysosomal phospholipase A and acyltransferase isoform X3 [Bemisia tabaci]|uniref:lysosomal phospholipase A and acyltransferase isoform X3 n=1 Tax=Bemisia tabaci TaxID=7038 RepID=UPI003B289BEE